KSFSQRRGALWLSLGQSSPTRVSEKASKLRLKVRQSLLKAGHLRLHQREPQLDLYLGHTRFRQSKGCHRQSGRQLRRLGLTSVDAVDLAVTVRHGWKGVSPWRPPCVTSPSPLLNVSTRWHQPVVRKYQRSYFPSPVVAAPWT